MPKVTQISIDTRECEPRKALEGVHLWIRHCAGGTLPWSTVAAQLQPHVSAALALPCPIYERLERYRQVMEKALDREIPASEGPLEFVLCSMRATSDALRENAQLRAEIARLRERAPGSEG